MTTVADEVRQRFASKVQESQSGCWEWTGTRVPNGYGQFGFKCDGRWVRTGAHRMSYEIHVGPIPDGLVIDHLCRNRACVNPDHLEPVTHAENLRRGVGFAGVNAHKQRCIRGHEFTPDNTMRSKLGRHCRRCHYERRDARYRRAREELLAWRQSVDAEAIEALTVGEAAEATGLPERRLRSLVEVGKLRSVVRSNRSQYFPVAELERCGLLRTGWRYMPLPKVDAR